MRLVSVLMPAYNSEKWIETTIRSITSQTWKNLELIIVDDGSSDNTLAIAKSFSAPNIKVISQENRGAAAARNRALKEAQGDVVQYIDADDLMAPDKIEKQMIHLKDDIICSCNWASFYKNPENVLFTENELTEDLSSLEWTISAWSNLGMMPLHAWLMNRVTAERTGLWNEALTLNDDGEYFARAVLNTKYVKYCPDAKVYYRLGNLSSLSRTNSHSSRRSGYFATVLSVNALLKIDQSERVKNAISRRVMDFNKSIYPYEPEMRKSLEDFLRDLDVEQARPIFKGTVLQKISNIFGWKAAKLLQKPYFLTIETTKKAIENIFPSSIKFTSKNS